MSFPSLPYPSSAQRLPDGRTMVTMTGSVVLVNRQGKVVRELLHFGGGFARSVVVPIPATAPD